MTAIVKCPCCSETFTLDVIVERGDDPGRPALQITDQDVQDLKRLRLMKEAT